MKNLIKLSIIALLIYACEDPASNSDVNKSKNDMISLMSNPDADIFLISIAHKGYDIPGYNNSLYSQQDFYFYDSTGNPVEPNSIKINNSLIDKWKNVALPYDGSNYTWEITGNADVPSFDMEVSGISMSSLNYPIPDTTKINKQQGITINFTPFTGTSAVALQIWEKRGLSKMLLDSTINPDATAPVYLLKEIDNSGSVTISPSMFQNFSSNMFVDINIFGYNVIDTLINDKLVRVASASSLNIIYEVE